MTRYYSMRGQLYREVGTSAENLIQVIEETVAERPELLQPGVLDPVVDRFTRKLPDAVETRVAPTVTTVAELARIAAPSDRPRVVVGDGAMRYRDDVLEWSGAEPMALESLLPNATTLLSLVARAGATRQLDDPLAAEPLYGRPAEAQAKWEARHGRPLPDPSRPAG